MLGLGCHTAGFWWPRHWVHCSDSLFHSAAHVWWDRSKKLTVSNGIFCLGLLALAGSFLFFISVSFLVVRLLCQERSHCGAPTGLTLTLSPRLASDLKLPFVLSFSGAAIVGVNHHTSPAIELSLFASHQGPTASLGFEGKRLHHFTFYSDVLAYLLSEPPKLCTLSFFKNISFRGPS